MRAAIAALALATATPSTAAWNKASTPHFIIYSEQKPDELRAFAEKLERFDQAARNILGRTDPAVGDGNRLTVFVLENVEAVQKIHATGNDAVYGFYIGRYSGPIAFTPRYAGERERGGLSAESVFFHEYAHHLMFQDFNAPYPNWYVEGFAELIGTPRFAPDGAVTLGVAPAHRAYGLFSQEGLSARRLLEAQPKRMTDAERESIYGRGWLLTHYLVFEPRRARQLRKFLANLASGQSMATASAVFGDLRQLDREMSDYVQRPRLSSVTVGAKSLQIGQIDVVSLSAGAAEVMPWRLISKRGVDPIKAKAVIGKIRPIGARYPADALVQVSLAEAELDVGDHKAALSAAEAALRAEPRNVEAMIYKGRAIAALAEKKEPGRTFAMARDAFLAANKIDPEDPEPLFHFFQTYAGERRQPTANALSALHYSSSLAPSDSELRFNSALAWLAEQKLDEARIDLLPIGYNPHGSDGAEIAKAAIDRIDQKDGPGAIAALAKAKKPPLAAK